MRNAIEKHAILAAVLLGLTGGLLQAQEIRRPPPLESSPDERAKFLAGQPPPGHSVLYGLQNTATYFNHLRTFGETWRNFERSHFQPKRDWAREELAARAPGSSVLYYMFAGPDFINATALFPDCGTYILVGLEPVGEVPPPEQLEEEQLAAGLENLRNTTDTTLKFSYFITKDMRADLERTAFRGVLPILYAFVALAGNTILSSDLISINNSGQLVERAGAGLPGVRIRFERYPGARPQTLYYIRADLSDAGLKSPAAPLLTWMRSFPPGAAYVKAASYLMHESYFSRIRDFLLGHCQTILQDDSGIPLRYFDTDKWQLYFFGSYTRPIEIFDRKFQPDLREAYESRSVPESLPFGTGYNFQPGESNLMLAVKRRTLAVPATEPFPDPRPTPGGQFITP